MSLTDSAMPSNAPDRVGADWPKRTPAHLPLIALPQSFLHQEVCHSKLKLHFAELNMRM